MKKLTKLEKFGLIAAIVTCGTYFYMNKVYDPEAKALARTVTQLNKTIKEYNDLGEAPPVEPLRKRAAGLREELEEVTAELKEAGGRTDQRAEITEVLTAITSLAERNRLQVARMAPQGEEKEALFTWAVYRAELAGGYRDFKRLVDQLQERLEPIQLRGLKLSRLDDQGRITITTDLLI